MRDDRERVRDMLDAIERIRRYAARGEAAFRSDELVQVWFVRHLQVLGEAARSMSPEFRAQHPAIPWAEVIGMRHVIVHEYFGIDLDIVWRVVDGELPRLETALRAAVDER